MAGPNARLRWRETRECRKASTVSTVAAYPPDPNEFIGISKSAGGHLLMPAGPGIGARRRLLAGPDDVRVESSFWTTGSLMVIELKLKLNLVGL